MFVVYAIESLATKRVYIGHTQDLDKRLQYHNSGYVKSTSKDRPWKLVALEKAKSKNEAGWIERALKRSKGKRIKWIQQNCIKT